MEEIRDTYRELFERSPDAILVIEGDRFIDCNQAAVRMLRYPSKQALLDRYTGDTRHGGLRAHPGEFSPPRQPDGRDSFEKADAMMEVAFARGSHSFEWDHVRADGEVFPVEVQLVVVRRGDKPILLVLWREIADRREAEAEVRRAQRLEAVGRLAGGIAHDFNNLLVLILSHAELMQAGLDSGQPDGDHLQAITAAAERATDLTRQLLAFSRGQPIQPRPTDLVALVDRLAKLLKPLIGEDIELVIASGPGPLTVEADPTQLEQLVMNLAANARDAMPGGGHLEISVRSVQVGPSSPLDPLPHGEYVALCVLDSGEGMSGDQLDHAFDPFYTTKASGEGSGLGLATVQAIAEQNRGRALIESRPGTGTQVRVLLPRSWASPLERTRERRQSHPPAGGETVLLVEDERAIRELIETVLTGSGYQVLGASDGEEAIRVVREYDSPIDLLITDVVMPRLSGPRLVEELGSLRPGLRVLYVSGYSHEGALVGAGSGAAKVLQKPFSPRVLLDEVRKILDSD
ncbi:MAG: ATP-binding protein [Myxococcota bacterium]